MGWDGGGVGCCWVKEGKIIESLSQGSSIILSSMLIDNYRSGNSIVKIR